MSRFVFIAAMVLCVGYATAADSATAATNPMQGLTQAYMQTFMDTIQQLQAAMSCPSTCGAQCGLQRLFCIPALQDCDAQSAACAASCDQLCGCFDACDTKCGTVQACLAKAPAEIPTCLLNTSFCLAPCQTQCPVTQITQTVSTQLVAASSQLTAVVSQLYGMMMGGGAGAGTTPSTPR